MSNEVYRQLFHRAREQRVEIPLQSMREAHRLRYQLNAYRKQARDRGDPDLPILEQIALTIEVRDQHPIVIAKVRDQELVSALRQALPAEAVSPGPYPPTQSTEDLAELLQRTITDDPYFRS